MPKADQTDLRLRIIIDQPVPGVRHSLQARDGTPLDPKSSAEGAALVFDLTVRIAPGPRFLGDQVQREGPQRRFVYIRIGQLAGDAASPWSRRIKIDIHDVAPSMLEQAMREDLVIETVIAGTAADGTPVCATQRPLARRTAPA